MTIPTNAPIGANAPSLPAVPAPTASTFIPSLGMTFADADAKARELLRAFSAIKGEDSESEAQRNELSDEWNWINATLFTTTPATAADALAVLDRLLCPFTGIPVGTSGMEEGALTLVRGFLAGTLPAPIPAPRPTHAEAVEAFRPAYSDLMDSLLRNGNADLFEAGFLMLAQRFQETLAAAGPLVSFSDALALANLQCDLLEAADGQESPKVLGARAVMVKAIADHLTHLAEPE